ncbi:hypothetical protein [uncultured Tessaracoccus sp.]|uniref:glycoside hydrolase 5 family protein n=1 Tax=uncultured Tessaracoccus sp. TaxID=905023 RepID=UPI0025D0E062|nr:hypothetical protein [uncultured Tessaracoccus sp.]
MRVGVNYTPRRGWFHSWLDFDRDDVRRDFEAIAGLGMDHVRVFPLWPLLQPNRGLVRPRAIADVLATCDVAQEFGLTVSVDALNGHLSSHDFLPSWVTSWHQEDLFTSPVAVAGERALLRELASALREHEACSGLTLGNEFAQFAAPVEPHRHPQASTATVGDVDRWLDGHFQVLRDAWPAGRHQHSFDDDLWFVDEHPFTPRHAVTAGDVTTVHAWVFMQVAPHFGADHPMMTGFPRYLLELARAWSPDPDRPLWLQEVGAPRPFVPDASAAAYVSGVVDAVLDTPGLVGLTWWCSHDVDRALLDFPELEYSLGLFTTDGVPKPEAHALTERIPELRAATPRTPTTQLEFVADWETGAGRHRTAPTGALARAWAERYAAGECAGLTRVG